MKQVWSQGKLAWFTGTCCAVNINEEKLNVADLYYSEWWKQQEESIPYYTYHLTDSTRGIFLWCFFLLITSISLIIFLQIKQQSSTRLVGALSSLSSNQGLTALKPVNQTLWHLQNQKGSLV
jgi:hypothetical protein